MLRFVLFAAALLIVAPAGAQVAPKTNGADVSSAASKALPTIDFTQYPLDQNGERMPDYLLRKPGDPTDKKYPDLTLGMAACHALNVPTKDEETLLLDERMRRGVLCEMKIKGQVNAWLEAGDVDLIKKRIAAVYTDNVFVRHAVCMIDAATKGCSDK